MMDEKDRKRVQKAKRWLELGKPIRAIRELSRLTRNAWKAKSPEPIVWKAALILD